MKKEKLHNHPYLEKTLRVPEDHVIIDRHTFECLIEIEKKQQGDTPLKKLPETQEEFVEFLCRYHGSGKPIRTFLKQYGFKEYDCDDCSYYPCNPNKNYKLPSYGCCGDHSERSTP